ncbi:unnamed protein product [Sphagnum troendelagicum]|uniref:K Homology domain-containing protein n=1 Tax=Sphagnum troendelagicum TaxID=128251 RepID=A0ABP0V552_9BRYO
MAEASTPATRQRKKRKWDQPAEAVAPAAYPVSAMPGIVPFGGAGHLASLGMPNMLASLVGVFPTMTLPMPLVSYTSSPSTAPNNVAAAIVQKINQDLVTKGLMPPVKIHDEVIAREIIINDADPGVRYKLTKRQTQEEIQAKTGAVVITRGRFRPPNGPPDSEKPLYLHISAGVQLKDTTERIKSVDAAAALVDEMMKQGPPPAGTIQSGGGGPPLSVVVNVGIEIDSSFNLIGRIRGPNDQYINHIMTKTGTEVAVRGIGSGYLESFSGEELQQPLHLLITGDNFKGVDDARRLAENLLDTIRVDSVAFRLPPTKVYGAVPPPQQLAGGGATESFSSIKSEPESRLAADQVQTSVSNTPAPLLPVSIPGSVKQGRPPQSDANLNYGPQNVNSYNQGARGLQNPSHPFPVTVPTTNYSGYGGVYPQVSPLQQVAQALQRPPPPVSVRPGNGLAVGGMQVADAQGTIPTHGQSNWHVEKRRDGPPQKERRKFQEFPMPAKQTTARDDSQVHRVTGPSRLDEQSVSTSGHNNINLSPLQTKLMPPPPPKSMPPPIRKALPKSPTEKEDCIDFLLTGLKLVEYGEEEDEDFTGESPSQPSYSNGKPFWAT